MGTVLVVVGDPKIGEILKKYGTVETYDTEGKRVADRERACRGCDQRVHSNPATLVTPTLSIPGPNLFHDDDGTPNGQKNDEETRDRNT